MRFRSLTTRFVVTVLLATAVPFLAFGRYVRDDVRDRLEEQVMLLLVQREAELAGRQLQNDLERTVRTVSLQLPDFQEVARFARPSASRADGMLKDKLTGRANEDVFESVLLVDPEGTPMAFWSNDLDPFQSERIQARAEEYDEYEVTESRWYRALHEQGRDFFPLDRHLSPFRHDDPSARLQDPQAYSYGIALPIASEELGYVVVRFPWSDIQRTVEDIASELQEGTELMGVEVELLSEYGEVLATSLDRSRIVESVTSSALFEALTQLPLRGSSRQDEGISLDIERDGVQLLVGVAAVSETVAGTYPWRFTISWPTEKLFATVFELEKNLYLITAIAIVLLVLAGGFVSHAALRPVGDLVNATERLAGGDLGVRVRVRGRDELADLAVAFNSMAEQLEKTQAQLRQAERDAAWAEMARQVAHEIKNPLTPMRMSAQRLARAHRLQDPRVPELVERTTRTVIEQTEQLQRIADDFRHFAGGPNRELVPVQVSALHERVRNDFAATGETEGEAKVVVHEPNDDVQILADLGELQRVFLNLVGNASAASGPDGTVEVSSALIDGPDGRVVEFSVLDDGPGIDPAIVEHLFEPYFTTKSSGTGLGLAICRRAIEAHGGHIQLVSVDPGSTEFRFTIPVVDPSESDGSA